jgi:hypothetical protein
MYKTLRNQRGNIAIAVALAMVGLLSGITMATMAYKDTVDARYDFDGIQELHLLRSEMYRAHSAVQRMDYSGDGFTLQSKNAVLIGSHSKSKFEMKTKVAKDAISTGGGLYFTSGYKIKSLVNGGRGTGTIWAKNKSMVSRYGERSVRRNTFAGYFYFTDNDASTNGTNVYFWGPDVIYGKVHSNSDIWLKQLGGGTNNGWPTFHGPVYTAKKIRSFSGPPPMTQVFRSGYWEDVSELEFNPQATSIRKNGAAVGPAAYDPNRIIFVTVDGGSYSSHLGNIITRPDTADVWTQYPPRAGTYVRRNRFMIADTIWTSGPAGPCAGRSNLVYSKLWLRSGTGGFFGKQTWCSVDTMYISDNIKLAGTSIGGCPDGSVAGTQANLNDYVGLVSEKSILIQYGYKDPQDSLRYKPNCSSDADGIWIYAAICALGDGNGNPHKDGVFTFEYQHPHPSVPAVRLGANPYVWDKIDLHRRVYPPPTPASWPGNIDLPWYNPLWPEGRPTMERGTIHIWGSVAQRRRGFVHRNVSDSEYPNPGNIWNVPMDLCGGTSGVAYTDPVLGVTFTPQNAVGATGSGVGYKKDYKFDNRFSFVSPPDYPETRMKRGQTPFESEAWALKKPPRSF